MYPHLPTVSLFLALLAKVGHCKPVPPRQSAETSSTDSTSLLTVHNITRLPGEAFENLAVRSNTQILTAVAGPSAKLFQVDPVRIRPPVLVSAFPGVAGAYGIIELEPDVFYVAAGNFSIAALGAPPGAGKIFEVDMRGFGALPNGTIIHPAAVREAADLPVTAILPNGVTRIDGNYGHVFVADSFAGVIWRVNVHTGSTDVAFNDTSTQPTKLIGVNGLKYDKGFFYYSNTGQETLYKLAVTREGLPAKNAIAQVVASGIATDDFALDVEGNAYMTGQDNIIQKITPKGKVSTIAGVLNSNSSGLIGPTAVRFGRGASDYESLYVSTDGAVFGTVLAAQGISRIDVGVRGAH